MSEEKKTFKWTKRIWLGEPPCLGAVSAIVKTYSYHKGSQGVEVEVLASDGNKAVSFYSDLGDTPALLAELEQFIKEVQAALEEAEKSLKGEE